MSDADDDAAGADGGKGGDGGAEHYSRGDRLAADGALGEAEQAYRRADDAGHPAAAAKLGMLLEFRGKPKAAREAYARADERGDRLGAFRLGLLLAGDDQWDDARAAWARADKREHDAAGFDLEAALHAGHGSPGRTPSGDQRSALANPVLVGAMTVLVAMVAVFLAYNSNAGLPFVPTRELKLNIASGSDLVAGNEVREGGYRIGLVSDMKPIELPSGQIGAQLTLKLNTSQGRVPVDSTAEIRPRSVLGLKYVDLHFGTSRRVFGDGGTMPISRTSVPVQFEDVFQAFDAKTRSAIDKNLVGFGDTLAGRGSALNDTIASLPALFGHLTPVARYLADPHTELTRFFDSLEGFMGTVAPVAATNARLFTDMATTFEAISRDPNALEATIAESPSTEQVSTQSLRVQQPFLVDLSTLGRRFTPATAELGRALPNINPAIEAGTTTLARTPSLNANLQQVMAALKNLAQAPGTNIGINALTSTVSTLNPMIRYLGPYQTVCDGWNYFWTYLSEHISEQTSFGFAQRALLNFG
ncbi:MAG: phospholipid/cholesterol/gamma-HCH transport system substrate-binding protein, partial [Solirubrobacteraceae bacterium]|nr:phospholipid/cholesterol/gamma-HCH transport system substrate-binding protein [Solirubrobacteraceae bacterium]